MRFSLLLLTLTLSLPASADPLAGTSLFESVKQYAGFGDHRTGSEGDHATTNWLAKELEAAGLEVKPQAFTLNQFFPSEQSLILGEHRIGVFPQWFPHTTRQPLQAPLVTFETESLSGHIAYLAPDKAGPWYQLRPPQLAAEAAARGALALVIAVPHPSGEIYVTNAAPPHLQEPVAIPTVVVAARDHRNIRRALDKGVEAVLTSEGVARPVEARNLLARYPAEPKPGSPWVVVSTPTSGWFQCAGERGGGVALWLGLARWIASQDTSQYNWLFVANSGHELNFTGAHHSLRAMPQPEAVHLWLHLGASIGARQWQDEEGLLKPLDRIHQYNRLYGDPILLPAIRAAYSDVPELEVLPTSKLNSGHSELGSIVNAGYTAFGMVGSHRFFHTPEDTPEVTDAGLLAPYGEALLRLAKILEQPTRGKPLQNARP